MHSDVDIAVVGAGAAGLAAAIFAAQTRPDLKIVLFDGAGTLGAKILVSGGGRCNVTHARVTPTDFHAPGRFVQRVLDGFGQRATIRWFESLGVPLKLESTGKMFPVSNTARSVLAALLGRCDELGVRIMANHRIQDVTPVDSRFRIVHEAGQVTARRGIMATGGRSLPKTGSDGQGWSIAKRLGHTITATYPALVPLLLEDSFFHRSLSGISHDVTLTTRVGGKPIDCRTGSLLWTHFGISGPVVLDASRFWVMAHGQGRDPKLFVSFLPGQSFEQVDRRLSAGANQTGGKTTAAMLRQQLPHRLVQALCRHGGHDGHVQAGAPGDLGATTLSQLPRSQRRALTHVLTDLEVPVVGARGWRYAEVTAGGIPLREVDPHSMVSRKVAGLYLVGEMLDCDGRIGGFNFQWAWATGHIAGCCAAMSLDSD